MPGKSILECFEENMGRILETYSGGFMVSPSDRYQWSYYSCLDDVQRRYPKYSGELEFLHRDRGTSTVIINLAEKKKVIDEAKAKKPIGRS